MDIWYKYGTIDRIYTYMTLQKAPYKDVVRAVRHSIGMTSLAYMDISQRYIYNEVKANGGWTRMDYTVTLKEETNE